MISMPLFLVLLATIALLWYYRRAKDWERRKGKLTELTGPKGLPLLGNLIRSTEMHDKLPKFADEFGDIFRLRMGPMHMVVISNPKMAKEIFMNDPNYVGRPFFPTRAIYEGEQLGIVWAEGDMWEVHRRFLLRQLRDFGFGKAAMENLILEEVREVIVALQKEEGRPIKDIKRTLQLAVVNSLWIVVSQQRFSHDNPELIKLVENTHNVTTFTFKKGALVVIAPWLRHIAPGWSGYTEMRKLIEENRLWFENCVEEHKRSFQDDVMRDFIDVYLAEVKKTTDPNSVFFGARAERQLVAILADLLFAGSDTTSTTLNWATLFLCKFPNVQKKLQKEIASITSDNSRHVQIADRPNMPYTLAVIEEVLRYSSISPFGLIHLAKEDKGFQGYFIPKNAFVVINLKHIHFNPRLWGDPKNFRPERFLSKDGQRFIKSDHLFPFEIGRRQCVGETLARDTIFLFLTNLFQKFSMTFDPSQPEPELEPVVNFILEPEPYSVVMKSRGEI